MGAIVFGVSGWIAALIVSCLLFKRCVELNHEWAKLRKAWKEEEMSDEQI